MRQPAPSPLQPLAPRRRLRWWWLGVGLLSLCIGATLAWFVGADTVIGQPIILADGPLPINATQSLGQTFVPPVDGLRRIDLYFTTRRRHRPGPVILRLSDLNGRLLVQRQIDSADLTERWHAFEFPPITGVAGSTLRLDIEREVTPRLSIFLWIGPGTAYPAGEGIYRDDIDPSFDLVFRAYMATPPTWPARLDRLGQVAAATTASRPGLIGQPGWLLGLGAAYAAGLAGLLWLVVSTTCGRPRS